MDYYGSEVEKQAHSFSKRVKGQESCYQVYSTTPNISDKSYKACLATMGASFMLIHHSSDSFSASSYTIHSPRPFKNVVNTIQSAHVAPHHEIPQKKSLWFQ
jgi:hypothetical protein